MKIPNKIKVAFFDSFQIIITLILLYRVTFLICYLSFINTDFLKLFILAVYIDSFINYNAVIINNIFFIKKYIRNLSKSEYKVLEDTEFTIEIKNELYKYQQHKIENLAKTKEIVFLQALNSGIGRYVSMPVSNWISYIIIPEKADLKSKRQQVLITHELAHCVGNDVLHIFILLIRIICVIMPVFSLVFIGICFKTVFLIILSAVLFASQIWCSMYAEIIANNLAIEILEAISTPIDKKEAADIIKFPMKIKLDRLKDKKTVRGLMQKTQVSLIIEYLDKVNKDTYIHRISPLNNYMMTLIIVLILMPLINMNNPIFINFNISFSNAIVMTFIFIIVYYIVKFLFLAVERSYKWKMKKSIGM
ncbi:hypothetical protein LY28_01447 [Ruminiclostridium sufflavum DSM 19573]|uniref:Uncharacterized protein n=1 Tax=Ruminiclostridium sufflavum DSM 19573 TaxID=1121337 RepID=A0A318XP35_9FIRM|nr:hypothetical protein [Ruminiclostridium sufflavum]PYG88596.1 hypothetical protein LY28_01447 [Ruminiclostridium sufflavum DSM 19573]